MANHLIERLERNDYFRRWNGYFTFDSGASAIVNISYLDHLYVSDYGSLETNEVLSMVQIASRPLLCWLQTNEKQLLRIIASAAMIDHQNYWNLVSPIPNDELASQIQFCEISCYLDNDSFTLKCNSCERKTLDEYLIVAYFNEDSQITDFQFIGGTRWV